MKGPAPARALICLTLGVGLFDPDSIVDGYQFGGRGVVMSPVDSCNWWDPSRIIGTIIVLFSWLHVRVGTCAWSDSPPWSSL